MGHIEKARAAENCETFASERHNANMIVKSQNKLGIVLVAVGCLWLILVQFRIKPLFLSLFYIAVWLKAPNGFAVMVTLVNEGEYLAALATVALGLTLWRRSSTGKWPLKMISGVFAVFIVGMGTRLAVKKRAAQKREVAYHSVLSEYQGDLRPGMARKEVEDYLRSKKADFTQMCCVEPNDLAKRHTWDDLVKIGEEEPPWFCGENYVYVAFQFVDHLQ
jgi:hypothetical protein